MISRPISSSLSFFFFQAEAVIRDLTVTGVQTCALPISALAQDNRLDVFRLLVKAGPEGLAAGEVAKRLKLPPNTLSFHFDRLRQAGLVAVRRESRSMI